MSIFKLRKDKNAQKNMHLEIGRKFKETYKR